MLLKGFGPTHSISILVQFCDKFMHSIVLYSTVLHCPQLYCIVNLLLCGYNTIQINLSEYWTTLSISP